MNSHKTPALLGGILLVIGNVVGAGILALPIATAELGLPAAIAALFIFWLVMMLGAHYFLEANLALPSGSNLISMSRATLGKYGTGIAWACNLIVMYSLIAAYISGGGDLVKINLHYLGINFPAEITGLIFVLIFGFIVSRGICTTDHTNRVLMFVKFSLFAVTIIGLASHFNPKIISFIPQKNLTASLLIIVITSFGFATLIPSLRNYYQSDIKKIKKIIFRGTFIPLIAYVIWIIAIFSIIPYHGNHGLLKIAQSSRPVSDLQLALSSALHIVWITQAMNIFSGICIITSFLANSISFADFIADGFNLYKNGQKMLSVYVIAYLPAIISVLFYSKIFLLGLSISGILAIIQLLILPSLIVWRLRYANRGKELSYSVFGGKVMLVFLLSLSFVILFYVLITGFFK